MQSLYSFQKVTQQGGEKHLMLAFSVSHYCAFVTEASLPVRKLGARGKALLTELVPTLLPLTQGSLLASLTGN